MIAWAEERGARLKWTHSICAAENNHIHLLDSMRNIWSEDITAYSGSLQTLQWLRTQGCPWSYKTLLFAAQMPQKDKDKFMWALQHGCPVNNDVMTSVINAGWVDAFERIHHLGRPLDLGWCMYFALSHRKKKIVDWLLAHGAEWPALAHGIWGVNDDMREWMRSRGYPY